MNSSQRLIQVIRRRLVFRKEAASFFFVSLGFFDLGRWSIWSQATSVYHTQAKQTVSPESFLKSNQNYIISIIPSEKRYFSMATNTVPIADYCEIIDLPNHPEKWLIDVREPHELKETGEIPCSINVPLGEVQIAFSDSTSDGEFTKKYGRGKPSKTTEIITSCRSGKRAGDAANILLGLGFTGVKNYKGSWTEYAEKQAANTKC